MEIFRLSGVRKHFGHIDLAMSLSGSIRHHVSVNGNCKQG